MNIVRTISKSIAPSHEISAFNESGDLIFSTNPFEYSSKDEFLRYISGKVNASQELKNFYKSFDLKKNAKILLSGSGSGLSNQFKKWTASTFYPYNDDLTIVSLVDISKHFIEKDKVENSYQKLETFFDKFPLGIFYINSIGHITGSNSTFSNMLNLGKDRLTNLAIDEFIKDFDYHTRSANQVSATIKPKFSKEFNATLIKSSDSTSSSLQTWIVIREAEKIPEKQEVNRDNEFIEQNSFISAKIPAVIINLSGKIEAYNPTFANLIQENVVLEKENIMKPGININAIIEDNSKFLEQIKTANQPFEIKLYGGKLSAMAYISRLPKDNRTLIQLVDISSQKILEQQFIHSQKMQAIGQLAGGIAHDFNNLLTAMIGFCDLLLQRYTQNDPSYGDVIQIKQNASRASNLVRQLLAFSKQQTLTPKVLSITNLLIDLSSLLKRLVGINIDLQIYHGRNIWPIKVDSSQFDQVIINLAVNARDAISGSGKITIRTSNYFTDKEFKCIFDTARAGDYVLIEVEDTGCGIPKDLVEKIFEPFFSNKDNQKKTAGAGTGLGLSTVYGIINQTGGYLNLESEPGKGTTFKIYIPRYKGYDHFDSKDNQESVTKDLTGNETILLVEDEDAVRLFAARALRDKGYRILEAASGDEAIKISKSEKFDLLISDVVMPKMDGPTLSKKLKDTNNDFKTIFISGYAESTFRQDLDKNSSIQFLQKPFTLKDLATKVKKVLSNVG